MIMANEYDVLFLSIPPNPWFNEVPPPQAAHVFSCVEFLVYVILGYAPICNRPALKDEHRAQIVLPDLAGPMKNTVSKFINLFASHGLCAG